MVWYMPYRLLRKMTSFWEGFSGKRFVCCALTVLYSIDSTVGRSIASISDLSDIFISAHHASVNMSSQVWYIGYRPPYRTKYITYCPGVMSITRMKACGLCSCEGSQLGSAYISKEKTTCNQSDHSNSLKGPIKFCKLHCVYLACSFLSME